MSFFFFFSRDSELSEPALTNRSSFHPPTREEQERYPHAYDANLRGHSGPIQTIVSPRFFILDELMQQTFMNKGINKIEDSYGGDVSSCMSNF